MDDPIEAEFVVSSAAEAIPCETEEEQQKRLYASALLKNSENPFLAALSVFTDRGFAFQISQTWPVDPLVLEYQKELVAEFGEEAFLPDKADWLRTVWKRMNSDYTETPDFTKLADLYAKARGFYPGMGGMSIENTNNTVNLISKVMVVSDSGTDEEWESKVRAQQKKLTSGDDG